MSANSISLIISGCCDILSHLGKNGIYSWVLSIFNLLSLHYYSQGWPPALCLTINACSCIHLDLTVRVASRGLPQSNKKCMKRSRKSHMWKLVASLSVSPGVMCKYLDLNHLSSYYHADSPLNQNLRLKTPRICFSIRTTTHHTAL